MELSNCIVVATPLGVRERVVGIVDLLKLLGSCSAIGAVDRDAVGVMPQRSSEESKRSVCKDFVRSRECGNTFCTHRGFLLGLPLDPTPEPYLGGLSMESPGRIMTRSAYIQ